MVPLNLWSTFTLIDGYQSLTGVKRSSEQVVGLGRHNHSLALSKRQQDHITHD